MTKSAQSSARPATIPYGMDGRRVHSWPGILSVVIPGLVLALLVFNRFVFLNPIIGDVESIAAIGFAVGWLMAIAAVIESSIRKRRLLLPILSLGVHGAATMWLIVQVIRAMFEIHAAGGPR